jgi:hypothetical protein
MRFLMKIERQVFGMLLLHDSLIFCKHLVIEVQCSWREADAIGNRDNYLAPCPENSCPAGTSESASGDVF